MRLVNYTPHLVSIYREEGLLNLPSVGLARVKETILEQRLVHGVAIRTTHYGDVTGLPDPVEGTVFIVSKMVFDQSHRTDLAYPTDFERNDDGSIAYANAIVVSRSFYDKDLK